MKIVFVNMNTDLNVTRGAGYVASAVVSAGHKLDFFDTCVTSVEKVAEKVIKGHYEILMISTMTILFPEAVRLVELIKQFKKITVLLGGLHSAILGPELLKKYEQIDYICIGEGESFVREFLEKYNKNSLYDIPNLCYRRNGKVIFNPVRPPEELSSLPPFPWHYFEDDAVVQKQMGFLYVNATRGCPFNCSYCCNGIYLKLYGKKYLRMRPVEDVINELKYLKNRYHPKVFYFGDEMILFDKKYAEDLFLRVKKEINIPYGFMARPEYINDENVRLFKKTGCKYVAIGIECGNEEFRRKQLNRRMSNKSLEDAFLKLKKAGIYTSSFNIIGYPCDNDDQLTQETIKINSKIKPDKVQVTVFYPFLGTKLYETCKKKGVIDPERKELARNYIEDSILKGRLLKYKLMRVNAIFSEDVFLSGISRKINSKKYIEKKNMNILDEHVKLIFKCLQKGCKEGAYVIIEDALELLKDFDKARECIQCLSLNNKKWRYLVSDVFYKIGEVYLYYKKPYWMQYYEKAAEMLSKKDKMTSADYQKTASIYKKMNRIDKAVEYYEKAIDGNGNKGVISSSYFHLGEIYYKKRKYKKAHIYFNSCLKNNINHIKCREYLSRLDRKKIHK